MTSDIPPPLAGFTTRGRGVLFGTRRSRQRDHTWASPCAPWLTLSACEDSAHKPRLLCCSLGGTLTELYWHLSWGTVVYYLIMSALVTFPSSRSVNKLIVSSWKKIRVRGNVSLLAHLFLLRGGGHNPLSSTLQWPLCPAPCFHLVLTSALRLMDNLHSPFKLPEVKSSERTLNNRVLNLCWFLSPFAACKYSAWGQTLTFPTDCL